MALDLAGLFIPEGYCLRKIGGGRPKKTARNIAVLLARKMHVDHRGELAKQADAAILEAWTGQPGISEESHIRAVIRSARKVLEGFEFAFPDGRCAVAMKSPEIKDSVGWYWCAGLHEAVQIEVAHFSRTVPQSYVFTRWPKKLPSSARGVK